MTDTLLRPEIHAFKFDPSTGSYFVVWEKYIALADYAFQATNALTDLTVGGSEFFGSEAHGFFKADIPACTKNINWQIEQARKMGAAQARARDAETIKAAEKLAIVAMNTQCATQEDANRLGREVAAFRAALTAIKESKDD